MCFYAQFGGGRAVSAQGYVDKAVLRANTLPAMDFSRAGSTECVGMSFRAHVHWREQGLRRHTHGPRRSDKRTAQQDLDSMREAATGLSRAEGFAAMQSEAKRLGDGKAPKREGSVAAFGNSFAACVRWREEGEMRYIYGPRRGEKRRAEMDLWVHA